MGKESQITLSAKVSLQMGQAVGMHLLRTDSSLSQFIEDLVHQAFLRSGKTLDDLPPAYDSSNAPPSSPQRVTLTTAIHPTTQDELTILASLDPDSKGRYSRAAALRRLIAAEFGLADPS